MRVYTFFHFSPSFELLRLIQRQRSRPFAPPPPPAPVHLLPLLPKLRIVALDPAEVLAALRPLPARPHTFFDFSLSFELLRSIQRRCSRPSAPSTSSSSGCGNSRHERKLGVADVGYVLGNAPACVATERGAKDLAGRVRGVKGRVWMRLEGHVRAAPDGPRPHPNSVHAVAVSVHASVPAIAAPAQSPHLEEVQKMYGVGMEIPEP
eukprot:361181-Chlamydomonas_euryale.AAC.1